MNREHDFEQAKRGPVAPVPKGKTRITILLDEDVVEWFKQQVHAAGGGNYQILINTVLRRYIEEEREPLEETTRVIRRGAEDRMKARTAPLGERVSGGGRRCSAEAAYPRLAEIALLQACRNLYHYFGPAKR